MIDESNGQQIDEPTIEFDLCSDDEDNQTKKIFKPIDFKNTMFGDNDSEYDFE
jgi:hypothetical protein